MGNKQISIFLVLSFLLLFGNFLAGHNTASVPFLKRAQESAGIKLQLCHIRPDVGDNRTFVALSLPLSASYEYNRYLSFSARLNQGYQTYDGSGLYGLSDMEIGARYFLNKNIT